MNPNKALWEKGDFARIAHTMRESGEALVKDLGITKGLKILDLGCGDGTTALPAARLGADGACTAMGGEWKRHRRSSPVGQRRGASAMQKSATWASSRCR